MTAISHVLLTDFLPSETVTTALAEPELAGAFQLTDVVVAFSGDPAVNAQEYVRVVAVDKVIIGAREAIRRVVNVRFGKMDKLYKMQEFDSTGNYTKEELDEIDKNVVLTQTFVQQSEA